ncbi:gp53-like domain-containing protein [Burkholderia gladioli]|uniref:gp53-like domain-containing protein n=1 Tax=Burkholderia gladioli TaxID=28095 RepID=UPI00163EFDA1|nr:hypothetical protein [Burkholderia gladioli]
MPAENDFLPFATGEGANVLSQAAYAAMTALGTGFQAGTAESAALNKVWRQSSIMSAMLGQFITSLTGQSALDDGTTATLLANFVAAIGIAGSNRTQLTDTGAANAYAAANPSPFTALPTVGGVTQVIRIAHANTGASTYAPDGLAPAPIYGMGGAPMQGGELVANGVATLVSFVGPQLNGGALCWVMTGCTGGSLQIADATAAKHAVSMGQFETLMQGSIADVATSMGFEVVLATNGYIKFPSWLGGWVVQWGSFTTSASGYSNWGFPRAFPSASLLTWATPQLSNNTPISIGINQPGATTALIPVAALSNSGGYSQIALSMLSIGK